MDVFFLAEKGLFKKIYTGSIDLPSPNENKCINTINY